VISGSNNQGSAQMAMPNGDDLKEKPEHNDDDALLGGLTIVRFKMYDDDERV
jgi:hypothetical protein